jgi:hypothetical protein
MKNPLEPIGTKTASLPRCPVNQGDDADVSKPNKIGASTPFDFNARNLRRAASGDHDAGVARIPSVSRGKPDGEALSTRGMGKSLPVAAGKSPSHYRGDH